jgi:hypothetical protein
MTISLTACTTAPAELPTRTHRRETLSPHARVISTSSMHLTHSVARRLCSRRSWRH